MNRFFLLKIGNIIFIKKMEINDLDYIGANIVKLPDEAIIKILLNYKDKLDECKARIEKQGIGTFLYLKKIPKNLAFHIRKAIELAL